MATRLSTGLRNFLLAKGSLAAAFNGGILEVRTGSQPASADNAPSGTKLVTFTNASGAYTAETPATGSIELTGGAAGSINTVTVGGVNILDTAVPFNSSLAQTASDLADAINQSVYNRDFDATVSSVTVTLTCRPGRGTYFNSEAVSATLTTITASYSNMASGAYAVNGLWFQDAASGILLKRATQIWSGVAVAGGTAGWFRLKGPATDADDSSTTALRLDGTIASSGGQLIMSPTTMTLGATQTLASFSPTIPAEF